MMGTNPPSLKRSSGLARACNRFQGKGCRICLLGGPGVSALVEVKGAKGALTEDQARWWMNWRGCRPVVVRSVDDAVQFIRLANKGLK